MLKPVIASQSLFNADHTLNIPEALSRIDYWTEYMRTGAPADIERGLSCLTILHKVLAKELQNV